MITSSFRSVWTSLSVMIHFFCLFKIKSIMSFRFSYRFLYHFCTHSWIISLMLTFRFFFRIFQKVHHFERLSVNHLFNCPTWPCWRSFVKIWTFPDKLENIVLLIFFMSELRVSFMTKVGWKRFWLFIFTMVHLTLRIILPSLLSLEICLDLTKSFLVVLFFGSLHRSKVKSAYFIIIFFIFCFKVLGDQLRWIF